MPKIIMKYTRDDPPEKWAYGVEKSSDHTAYTCSRIRASATCKFTESQGAVNVLKFRTLYSILFWLNFCFLCMLKGMANSEESDLGLHCLHMAFYQKLWCSNF